MGPAILTLTNFLKTRQCKFCGSEIIYTHYQSYWNAVNRNSGCRSCRSANNNRSPNRNVKKENNSNWKGYKNVGYNWFSKYFERSSRKHTGTITIQDAYNKLEAQGFRCALSGIPLAWSEDSGMSIDRIDSDKEYDLDNIQIVHKNVNLMKNHFDQDYFIEVCKRIVYNMGTT